MSPYTPRPRLPIGPVVLPAIDVSWPRLTPAHESLRECPRCRGTGRLLVDPEGRPRDQDTDYPCWPQYAKQGWLECRNCGGQSMSGRGTGYTRPDPNKPDQGCWHIFQGQNAGRCYTIYSCIKGCGERYDIDSSD